MDGTGPIQCWFDSGGSRCAGWFYTPAGEPPHACVVLGHGFGAAPEGPLGLVARRLSAVGLAAFTFDFRHFGASEGSPRYVLDVKRQLDDWAAAIAHVRSRPDTDADRIGLWGSSLTGGEVICVAARDRSIATAVAQVPYCDGFSIARAAGLRHSIRLLPALARDVLQRRLGLEPYLIDAIGPPGATAVISTRFDDVYGRTINRVPGWPNQLAAASLLEIYRFRPIESAHEVRCPLLVVLSYIDKVAPPGPGMRSAAGLPYVELALFKARHFDLYSGEVAERALHTEALFLAHHLGVSRGVAAPSAAPEPSTST